MDLDGEGLYYPCSENKDADQLHGYVEADLRLCFRIYAKSRFSHNEAQITLYCFTGFDDLNLTINTDMATVVKAMANPDSGLEIRDRMWLKITIPNAFIGKRRNC